MSEDNRKLVVRLAIAFDLVVVATGLALFLRFEPVALLSLYVAAVAIASWKSGWRGGALAVLLSTIALLALFGSSFDESHLIAFVVDGAIATAIMEAAHPSRRTRRDPAARTEFGKLVVVPPVDPEERERDSARRQQIARSLERAAAAQLESQRHAAQDDAEGASITPLDPTRGKRNSRSKRG